jgi:hypothetical protein
MESNPKDKDSVSNNTITEDRTVTNLIMDPNGQQYTCTHRGVYLESTMVLIWNRLRDGGIFVGAHKVVLQKQGPYLIDMVYQSPVYEHEPN